MAAAQVSLLIAGVVAVCHARSSRWLLPRLSWSFHRIGELIPLRERRRFVSRQEFIAMSRNAPAIDPGAFRADQDAALDHEAGSAYEQ